MPKLKHAIIALTLLLGVALESPAQILEAVQLIDDLPLLASVTSIEISLDGNHLYAVSPAAQQVSAYARDAQTGTLVLVNSEPYPTAGNTSGQFGSQARLILNAQFLLVGSLFENGRDLVMFQRDAASGELTLINAALLSLTADQRMLRFAVSPSGDFLYVLVLDIIDPTSTTNRTIDLRSYAISDSGVISLLDTRLIQDVGPATVGQSLIVSPDGLHLYVTGIPLIFNNNNIPGLSFSRNNATGLLTLLGQQAELGRIGPPAAIFNSDGTTLFYREPSLSTPPSSLLGSLNRDPVTGALTFAAQIGVSGEDEAYDDDLVLAENDRLLATAASSYRIELYLTPASSSRFINLNNNISNSLTSGTFASAVSFSPDEAFLYVALDGTASADDGMLIFSNRGLLEPPAVPTLSALASLLLMALLLLVAIYNKWLKQ